MRAVAIDLDEVIEATLRFYLAIDKSGLLSRDESSNAVQNCAEIIWLNTDSDIEYEIERKTGLTLRQYLKKEIYDYLQRKGLGDS